MKRILAILSLCAAAPAGGAALVDIGVASAVRGSVKAVAPGAAAGRVVETGKTVYSHDKVTTGPEGKLQILLLDETSFTIGANSELELDEFVFDPKTNAGSVSAKIAKGSFRFVTGKVAARDPGRMKVTTPVGVIGIRGTMTAGVVGADEATVVLLGPGPQNDADEKPGGITVSNAQGSADIDQDGWGVTVRAGEAPGKPFELPQGQLDAILSGVGSAPASGAANEDKGAGETAGASSGERTAQGKETVSDAFAAVDAAKDETSQFASQQLSTPKASKWADVIAIPGGTGVYATSGSYYDCTGGTCGTSAMGTMSYSINIDFAAKTLGGGTSSITLTAPASVSGTVNLVSYASLTGDAATSLSLTSANGNFSGTGIKLLDTGEVVAGAASVDVRVFNTGSPSVTYGGPLSSSLSQ